MSLRRRAQQLARRFEREYVTYNRIEVSRAALVQNAELLADLAPGNTIIPVLKSNAYGHGIAEVASALRIMPFPYLVVDGYFEALRVHEVSDQAVLVMGAVRPENFTRLDPAGCAFVVSDAAAIKALGAMHQAVAVHLEIETGMHRYGARLEDLAGLLELLRSLPQLQLEGVMSHLADADGETAEYSQQQAKIFEDAVAAVRAAGFRPRWLHLSNSAGTAAKLPGSANAVRPGIAFYGINPLPAGHPANSRFHYLQPALRLASTVTKVQELRAGERISYNGIFTAPEDMPVGVLPLGYYEGVPRALSNSGVVKLTTSQQHGSGSRFVPIIGRVCMNHTMVDLRDCLPEVRVGDEVTVISDEPQDRNSIAGIAREHGLFAYELLTRLSADVRRRIVH